jgi:hypothetical protein
MTSTIKGLGDYMLQVIATISTALTAIGSALSTISTAVKGLLTRLPSLMEKIQPIVETVFDTMQVIDQFKGIKSAEQLGDKVLQAQEQDISLENCDGDLEAYNAEVSKFKVSAEKSEELTSEDKYTAALILLTATLEKQYGPGVEQIASLIQRSPDFFNSDRLVVYLKACDGTSLAISDICNYFSSNLERREAVVVEEALLNVESRLQNTEDTSILTQSIKQERE